VPFYIYRCDGCGREEEVFRRAYGVIASWACIECPTGVYRHVIAQPVGIAGFARTPMAEREIKIGAFQEASQELEHAHSRQTNADGSLKPTPPLWQTAKREAKRLMQLGVKDSEDLR